MVGKIGDRAASAILMVMCGATLYALAMTSAAKKANLTGVKPIDKTSAVRDFEEKLKAFERQN